MKKILCICAACAGVLAAVVACGQKSNKVTAVVAGPEGQPIALVVEYDNPIAASSVTPEAFKVDGKEIAQVFVSDVNPFAKPEAPKGPKPEAKPEGAPAGQPAPQAQPGQPAPKPECDGKDCQKAEGEVKDCCKEGKPGQPGPKGPECKGPQSKDGKYVVVVLKGACDKPGVAPGQPGPKGPECCPDGDMAKCDKPEAEKCDSCKAAKGPQPGQPAPKPEAKPEGAPAGQPAPQAQPGQPEAKPAPQGEKAEIAVPEISVQQVAELKTVDGKAVKAWKKAVKATEAVPAPMHHGRHGHGHHGCPQGQPGQPGQPAPAGQPGPQPGQPAPQQPKAE